MTVRPNRRVPRVVHVLLDALPRCGAMGFPRVPLDDRAVLCPDCAAMEIRPVATYLRALARAAADGTPSFLAPARRAQFIRELAERAGPLGERARRALAARD